MQSERYFGGMGGASVGRGALAVKLAGAGFIGNKEPNSTC